MASEIEKLLKEQQSTSLQLELLNRTQETQEAILLEAEILNEENEKNADTMKKLLNDITVRVNTIPTKPIIIDQDGDVRPVKVVNIEDFNQSSRVVIPEIMDDFAPVIENINNLPMLPAPIVDIPDSSPLPAAIVNVDAPELESPVISAPESSPVPVVINNEQPGEFPLVEATPLTPEVLDAEMFGELETVGEKQLFALTAIDRGIDNLVRMAQDSSEVVGTSSGFDSTDTPDTDEDDGGSLLDFIGLGSKGKGGKLLGKFGKALKIGGAVIGAAFFLKDLFDGFTNDETIMEVTGKAKKDLTDAESSAASIANAISGLTFGLLPARDIFETITPLVEMFQSGIDELFDPDTGLFGTVVGGLFRAVDAFTEGDIMGGISEIGSSLLELPQRIFETVGRWFNNLIEVLPNEVGKVLKDRVSDAGELIGGAVSGVKSFFGFGDEEEETGQAVAQTGRQEAKPLLDSDGNTFRTRPRAQVLNAVRERTQDSRAISPAQASGAERTNALSKQRFEEAQQAKVLQPTDERPIVVQVPKSEKASITREAGNSGTDLRLGLMNSGGMDL